MLGLRHAYEKGRGFHIGKALCFQQHADNLFPGAVWVQNCNLFHLATNPVSWAVYSESRDKTHVDCAKFARGTSMTMRVSLEHLRKLTDALSKMRLKGQPRDSLMTRMRQVLIPTSSSALIGQLAREICKYRAMMEVEGYILISVTEIETRFGESRQDVREAFRLLQASGIAKRTEFKDRWALRS